MTILIADDNEGYRSLVRCLLESEGYHSIREARNGREAAEVLERASEPVVALIDWEMPELEGVEVCRRARARPDAPPMFLLLLTVRSSQPDIVAGFDAGANDFVTKPFGSAELMARVKTGTQMLQLQEALFDRLHDLEEALTRVKQLSGLLPICAYCKKIRDDHDYWQQVEEYISKHSEAQFSHSICPQCYAVRIKPELDKFGVGDGPQEKSLGFGT